MSIKLVKELQEAARINPVVDISLLEHSRASMKEYGLYTIEDRALPDFRDGLKPVQRRILWSAFKEGLNSSNKRKKAAFIVGQALGKYHPHGDTSVFSAMVTMNNSSSPMLDGSGNWGGGVANDQSAAMRYIESRLSHLADSVYFHPDYMPVTDYVENYDGSLQEPLILPARLPALLLNATSGVAVGITTDIPAYTLESLKKAIQVTLKKGKPMTAEQSVKYLEFNAPLGGPCISSDEVLLDFYNNTFGAVEFCSEYEYDEKNRTMFFTKFAPQLNLDSVLNFLNGNSAKPPAWVKDIEDARETSSKVQHNTVTVKIKKSVPLKNIDDLISKINEKFITKVHYKINVIERYIDGTQSRAVLKSFTIPELIHEWCKWRTELETKVLAYKVKVLTSKQKRTELLIYAASKLDELVVALKSENTEATMMKLLKITGEEADIIIGLRFGQLAKLDIDKLKDDLVHFKKELEYFKTLNPVTSILNTLDSIK